MTSLDVNKVNPFQIIFIHNSFAEKGVDAEIIEKIKDQVKNNKIDIKLIRFSGSTSPFTIEAKKIYRISRQYFNNHIRHFVECKKYFNRWFMESFKDKDDFKHDFLLPKLKNNSIDVAELQNVAGYFGYKKEIVKKITADNKAKFVKLLKEKIIDKKDDDE